MGLYTHCPAPEYVRNLLFRPGLLQGSEVWGTIILSPSSKEQYWS